MHDRVQSVVHRFVDAKSNMGLAVGIVHGGETHCFRFGKREAVGGEIDERTLFEIGSITKVFTTTLLADMHVRGEVDLDDPINRYLPPEGQMPDKAGVPVTLRHLATHSAGLPRLPPNMKLWKIDAKNPYATFTVEDLYAATSSRPPKRKPGTSTAYSNYGMGLLGHVLSLAAGMDYEELVSERICKPLGMDDTVITLTEDQQERLAPGHRGGKKVSNWDLPTLAGAGAFRSTVRDMTRFLKANMDPASTPLAEAICLAHSIHTQPRGMNPGPGITAIVAACLFAAVFGTFDFGIPGWIEIAIAFAAVAGILWFWPPRLEKMALGWHFDSVGKDKAPVLWHNGGTGGYGSYLAFIENGDTGVVLLSNSNVGPDWYGMRLLQKMAQELGSSNY